MSTSTEGVVQQETDRIQKEDATVRFAGDSGDGMQLAGTQFTNTSALAGNDVATFPDFPAEIRAPRGTLAGVSGFQIHFASRDIYTPGDRLDVLVAMNPAALKTNLEDLEKGGVLIVNSEAFEGKDLEKAGYETNPLEDGSLEDYRLFSVDMTKLTRGAVDGLGLSVKEADRCRNFFAMGLVYWMFGRSLEPTQRFIENKFRSKPTVAEANRRALEAGRNYGETTDASISTFKVDPAQLAPGRYRNMTGNQLLAYGFMTAAKLSGCELFLGSYPITPASDILHELSKYKNFGVRTFQAEDEIAAVCAAVGAAFGGAMAITTSSGPGIALKGEAMGLGVMLELPMIVINVQRGGPSTGLPTKTEQADLLQALFGRNGECPMPVLAASSPADCFDTAQEAWRVATRFMTPVMLLSDGYIANGAEPWRIPDFDQLEKFPVSHPEGRPLDRDGDGDADPFMPYARNNDLARPWALPGTEGLMHRVGGLEKQDLTGNVSYDPENHEHMVRLRQQKTDNVRRMIPPTQVMGPASGDVLILSWGGTYGACVSGAKQLQDRGESVGHVHLRYVNPLPGDLEDVMRRFKKVLIPELNLGQLRLLIRGNYLIDAIGFNKIQGKPFTTSDLVDKVDEVLRDM